MRPVPAPAGTVGAGMKAVVEPLEGTKVKLSVDIDEDEFEQALNSAFVRIAREVRIPGFRPGKAPRKLLEARLGKDAARQEALREALPDYYAKAVRDTDVDPIASPEIDITAGQESGPVSFDAVVEVRPVVAIPGYGGLRVTVPSPAVTDEDIDRQIDRLRNNSAELQAVDRPVKPGDFVTIDLKGTRNGEDLPGLTADDFMYEVGSGSLVPELDDRLPSAKIGEIIDVAVALPGDPEGEPSASARVLVKDVKEKALPEVTDEWASEASEFDTVEELREDFRTRLNPVKRLNANLAMRDGALRALVELVDEEAPEPLVNSEIERRLHDLEHRLQHQGAGLAEYLQATGQTGEELIAGLRTEAAEAVKADLALRALAEAESLEVTEEDLDNEIVRLAEQFKQDVYRIRQQLEQAEQLQAVRSDLKKQKALQWLVDHVEVVDEEGHAVDRADLEPVEESDQSSDTAPSEEPADADPTSVESPA